MFCGVIGLGSFWRMILCLSVYFLSRKSPPAPVLSRTFVTMVLFPLTVLLMMGIEMFIDFDPKSAISTEDILSVSNTYLKTLFQYVFVQFVFFFLVHVCDQVLHLRSC